MSSATRIVGRLLTAVLVSTAVALGPSAVFEPAVFESVAMAAPYPGITLSAAQGKPGTHISVHGSGFDDCYLGGLHTAVGDTTKRRPGTVELSMGDAAPSTTEPVALGAGTFDGGLTVSDNAAPGDYTVRAVCVTKTDIYAEGTFTVLSEEEAALTVDPAEGSPETNAVAEGSGFYCSRVEVTWDAAEPLASAVPAPETGTFTAPFQIPADSSEGTHAVHATCTDEYDGSDEADFTVTAAETNGTGAGGQDDGGQTDGGQTNGGQDNGGQTNGGDTNGGQDNGGQTGGGTDGGTGSVDGTTPAGWVVGPATLGGVLLLAAAGFALVRHRQRGPHWVHDHVTTQLRPGTRSSDVREPYDAGPPTRTVRLEPHPDPGDQSIDRGG
jgi:hypothetical protein